MSDTALTLALNEANLPGNSEAYQQLQRLTQEGALTVFTGAGTSAPAYPTWGPTLLELLAQAEREGIIRDPNELSELRSKVYTDPLQTASFIEEAFSRPVFRDLLASIFRPKDLATESHESIVRLQPVGVITLNYDNGLEVAYARAFSRPAHVIRANDQYELTRWTQGRLKGLGQIPILHWHGVSTSPEEMVLTAEDYDTFYADKSRAAFLGQVWRDERVLSVGFAFSDPFLVRLAETELRSLTSANRHFALIGVRPGEAITALTRRAFSRRYRLTPVFYDVLISEEGTEDHQHLSVLLNALSASVRTSSIPSTTSSPPSGSLPVRATEIGRPGTDTAPLRPFETSSGACSS